MSEEVDGKRCSCFTQGERYTEPGFFLTAVVAEVDGGTDIPGPGVPEQ